MRAPRFRIALGGYFTVFGFSPSWGRHAGILFLETVTPYLIAA